MKNKLNPLMLALLLATPVAFGGQADLNRLGKEVIDAENVVTGIEHDRDRWETRHPDPKKWTAEERRQADAFPIAIEKAEKAAAAKRKELQVAENTFPTAQERRPAAGTAYEHSNGSCPFVADTLAFAPGATWRQDGKLKFANKKTVSSESSEANAQNFMIRGHGVPFASPENGGALTRVRLEYSEDGKLSRLELGEHKQIRRQRSEWKQAMDYSWNGDECSVKRVTVEAPELAGRTGVSYDRELCRAIENKGLLDDKKIDECADFNDRIGAEIEKASKDFGPGKSFALFTTDPSGRTSLREWQKKDHLSVNSAIARDCAFNLKNGGKPAGMKGSASPNDGTHNGTSAR